MQRLLAWVGRTRGLIGVVGLVWWYGSLVSDAGTGGCLQKQGVSRVWDARRKKA